MDRQPENPCVFCRYARMKKNICGIYCTGGFVKQDGSCEHFKPYREKHNGGKP